MNLDVASIARHVDYSSGVDTIPPPLALHARTGNLGEHRTILAKISYEPKRSGAEICTRDFKLNVCTYERKPNTDHRALSRSVGVNLSGMSVA